MFKSGHKTLLSSIQQHSRSTPSVLMMRKQLTSGVGASFLSNQKVSYSAFIRPSLLHDENEQFNPQQAQEIISKINKQSILMRNNEKKPVKSKKGASFIPPRIRHRVRSPTTSFGL